MPFLGPLIVRSGRRLRTSNLNRSGMTPATRRLASIVSASSRSSPRFQYRDASHIAAAMTSIALSSASDDTQLRDRSIVGVATCAQARATFRSLSNGRKCNGSADIETFWRVHLLACLTVQADPGSTPNFLVSLEFCRHGA